MGTGCYNISWTQMPYSGALAYCTSLDSHLTFITSAEEQGNMEMFLNANAVDGKYPFVGKLPKKSIKADTEPNKFSHKLYKTNFVDRVWMGGFDIYSNDTYYWLDGSAVEDGYTNWISNEPSGGDHDALYLNYDNNWQWADNPVYQSWYPLCEIHL